MTMISGPPDRRRQMRNRAHSVGRHDVTDAFKPAHRMEESGL